MKSIAQYIDYTNLSNKTTRKEINQMINDCIEHNFFGLCIAPCWIPYAKNRIEKCRIKYLKLITVPNWYVGGGLAQCDGITDLVCEVADEIDFIWNVYEYSDLKAWDRIEEELKTIREKTKGKLESDEKSGVEEASVESKEAPETSPPEENLENVKDGDESNPDEGAEFWLVLQPVPAVGGQAVSL